MRRLFLLIVIFSVYFLFQIQGQTWSPLKRLTWNAGDSKNPSITTDENSGIHLVWDDMSNKGREIFYKRSLDGGSTWSGVSRLSWTVGESNRPTIDADDYTGIHLAWCDLTQGLPEISYKRSTDRGASWSAPTRLTWSSGSAWNPCIVADGGSGIHVVWQDDFAGWSCDEILYKRSIDSGVTWSSTARLTWNLNWSRNPAMAEDTIGGIHVVWCDASPGNDEIFYKRSTDCGDTWSGLARLTWTQGWSLDPSIAANEGHDIFVAWYDSTAGSPEIYYKHSSDYGTTWSGARRLTWNNTTSSNPSVVAFSPRNFHVVWSDNLSGSYCYDLFYKHSSDDGSTWSNVIRLTWNGGMIPVFPILSTDENDSLHLVWSEDTPDNYEIYYKNRK